jgi:phosphopantothenoylcysteine decarboxylase/phosphopantothenate--cysteine ligase
MLIAPATADLVARLAAGRADDLLTTVALATAAPLLVAPAMNQQMWRDPATSDNVHTLGSRGIRLVGPASGEQACGDVGPGRMEEPAVIVAAAAGLFESALLAGKRVIVTAGPTREAIDPVRYISNHSSGKMGYALARAAAEAGALTTLVSGPVTLPAPEHVKLVEVESALDMLESCQGLIEDCDIFIACAAVADYRPVETQGTKIKKSEEQITLKLIRNPDIVSLVAAAANGPFTVGFAAETNDVLSYARDKMQRKGLDMIIANDVSDRSIGFNSDDNEVTVLWPGGESVLARAGKDSIARHIVELIAQRLTGSD